MAKIIMGTVIKVENLDFHYRSSQPMILKQLSFEVESKTFIGIAGPNGAGKTTLLNLLCGLLKPETGTIEIDTVPIESYSLRKLAQKIAVVRQEFVPVFDFSVAEVASMARTPYLGTFGFETKVDNKCVNDALEVTETAQFASRPLGQLSGGERQRVFIARALAQDTPIMLLDEPTSFLDLKHQVGIYDLLKRMQLEKGKTILTVTHDINLASQYCDVVLLLSADGNYRYGCVGDVFLPEQIEKVFGVTTFSGNIGREKFFIPLGRFAKDSNTLRDSSSSKKQQ